MPQIKTAERILEFLKEQDKAVTPTAINKKTGVAYNSVLASVDTLEKWGHIETVTDGHICLIRFKDGGKNGYEFGHKD